MAEEKFSFESYQDTETIRNYLESLIEGIGKQRLALTAEGREIVLHPAGLLRITVNARRKGGKNRLSIEMAWNENKQKSAEPERIMEISS